MSVNYGSVIPANVDINDIEIQFTFQKSYAESPTEFINVNALQFITQTVIPDNIGENNGGLYQFTIPSQFYASRGLGIYNFYIRPKRMRLVIRDCSFLEDNSEKGIILDLNQMDSYARSIFQVNNKAIGLMITYLDSTVNGKLVPNIYRLITSNYRVEPISTSINNTNNQNGIRYRINDNSNLVFLSVSPQTTGLNNQIDNLFIGVPTQGIIVYGTYFDPVMLNVEVTDVDEKLLYDGIFGNQTFNYTNSIRTYYDDDGNIILQKDEYTEKDAFNNPLRKISKVRDVLDFNETL